MNKENVKTESGKEWDFYRTVNDVNGNPRYVVSWLTLGIPGYAAENDSHTRKLLSKCGLSIYRGKDFGGGYVFQSYNIRKSAEFFETTLKEKPPVSEIERVFKYLADISGFPTSYEEAKEKKQKYYLWLENSSSYGGYRLVLVLVEGGGHAGAFGYSGSENRLKEKEMIQKIRGIITGIEYQKARATKNKNTKFNFPTRAK